MVLDRRTQSPACVLLLALIGVVGCGGNAPEARPASDSGLSTVERLGKSIFFDRRLSLRGNQSCASCHAPEVGWTGDLSSINAGSAVYEGSVAGLFSRRKPPAAAYAMAPVFHSEVEDDEPLFVGGLFWDGRATGERLGDPLAEQAQGPFVNPVEQALPDTGCVVYRVCAATYPVSLESQFPGSCAIDWPADTEAICHMPVGALLLKPHDRAASDRAYDRIASAIAAYERSREVNPFSSKFDRYLAGAAVLSAEEQAGLELFAGRGKCAACHPIEKGPDGAAPLLTDFTFDNLGIPRNPENPWYRAAGNAAGLAWVDEGLGAFLLTRPEWRAAAAANIGKHKVPTLRNVERRPDRAFVKAYMHNGYFKTLYGLVHFYNTRDVKPVCGEPLTEREALERDCWPAPEVAATVNSEELGDLGLSQAEERAIVAFMGALSDGYEPAADPR
ncbi:MAG: cytochrome-c peroxidase [Vicinamibacterales bacterium]